MKKKSTELAVGVFVLMGFFAISYTAVNIGGLRFLTQSEYSLYAAFPSVAGLKSGATVEIAGVEIGRVKSISLKEGSAWVELSIDSDIKIENDSLASVRTKGLIGEKFIKITLGGEEEYLANGDEILDTEPALEIEELIGKFLYSSDSADEKKQ